MKSCLILSGGDFFLLDKSYVESADFIIACDRGCEYAKKLNIKYDLAIGDFDSCDFEQVNQINSKIIKLSCEKDDTDTMAAVKIALEKGFSDIKIAFCFGGRFDHALSNVQTASFIVNQNKKNKVTLIGEKDIFYAFSNSSIKLQKSKNSYFSVFSLSDLCKNVCISGAKYCVDNVDFFNYLPIGQSNEFSSSEVIISVENGILAVLTTVLN